MLLLYEFEDIVVRGLFSAVITVSLLASVVFDMSYKLLSRGFTSLTSRFSLMVLGFYFSDPLCAIS